MEQYFCSIVNVIVNLVFQILIEESEILRFSKLPCANFLWKGNTEQLHSYSEQRMQRKVKGRRDIKELKHENAIISGQFRPQFCDLKPSSSTVGSLAPKTTHFYPCAASSCPLVFMDTSVLGSTS